MTTKDQERKALEQIKKIVASLGEDSYIGTAFEGCFEIAAENIENDFACSMKQRKEAAEAAEDSLREKVATLTKQVEAHKNARELAEQTMRLESERANSLVEKLQNYKKAADEANQEFAITNGKLEILRAETDAERKRMQEEIIHLKAKLYDLMTAGK